MCSLRWNYCHRQLSFTACLLRVAQSCVCPAGSSHLVSSHELCEMKHCYSCVTKGETEAGTFAHGHRGLQLLLLIVWSFYANEYDVNIGKSMAFSCKF